MKGNRNMHKRSVISRISFALVLCLAAGWLFAGPRADRVEYFVSVDGDDNHDGRSLEQAFQTIQHGVDALEEGDTLTIAPGEYF